MLISKERVDNYGRSSCAFSDLVVRGFGTGGMGDSKVCSAAVSVGGLAAGGELEAIVHCFSLRGLSLLLSFYAYKGGYLI